MGWDATPGREERWERTPVVAALTFSDASLHICKVCRLHARGALPTLVPAFKRSTEGRRLPSGCIHGLQQVPPVGIPSAKSQGGKVPYPSNSTTISREQEPGITTPFPDGKETGPCEERDHYQKRRLPCRVFFFFIYINPGDKPSFFFLSAF